MWIIQIYFPFLYFPHLFFDKLLHFPFLREFKLVFRNEKPIVHTGQGIFRQSMVLFVQSRIPTSGLSHSIIRNLRN